MLCIKTAKENLLQGGTLIGFPLNFMQLRFNRDLYRREDRGVSVDKIKSNQMRCLAARWFKIAIWWMSPLSSFKSVSQRPGLLLQFASILYQRLAQFCCRDEKPVDANKKPDVILMSCVLNFRSPFCFRNLLFLLVVSLFEADKQGIILMHGM